MAVIRPESIKSIMSTVRFPVNPGGRGGMPEGRSWKLEAGNWKLEVRIKPKT
ncbi:MAG: hypothetical protein WCI51_13745 [Lentisphaerota bacterium]